MLQENYDNRINQREKKMYQWRSEEVNAVWQKHLLYLRLDSYQQKDLYGVYNTIIVIYSVLNYCYD